MDLSKLDTAAGGEAGAVMTLRHPSDKDQIVTHDDDTPQTITLAGYDSPRWRKANREQIDAQVAKGRKSQITADEMENNSIELLVAATLDWNITLDGEKPKFSPDAARKFYKRFIWVREQVDNFAANRANFIKA